MNKLEQLKNICTIVADTGDIEAMAQYKPLDATTNPSLILKASQLPQYQSLLNQAFEYAQQADTISKQCSLACDKLAVLIGKEILSIIDGRISTEVDARLSFDTRATIEKARFLIHLYDECGIDKSRILIKIASTWEGIQAAKVLEKEGIQCNLTLLFNLAQAQACADAGVYLISPFVGRISDYHGIDSHAKNYNSANDPGVNSVKSIYELYKSNHYTTIIMAASFRSTGQIEALAGCDRLTISPALLQKLQDDNADIKTALTHDTNSAHQQSDAITQEQWRYQMNADAMATEKLSDGIRQFIADQEKLEQHFMHFEQTSAA